MAKKENWQKYQKIKKKKEILDIPTGVLLLLIGAALAIIMVIFIQLHAPSQPVQTCSDGWSYETEDGKIIKTYVAERDTCSKKEQK